MYLQIKTSKKCKCCELFKIHKRLKMEGSIVILPLAVALYLVVSSLVGGVHGASTVPRDLGLTRNYYKKTNSCASVEQFVRHQVKLHWDGDKTITTKLLRLVYSDCMVTGCDASVLLDGPDSEKTAPQNNGLGGFVFIDRIKKVVEQYCPRVVSCADILFLATRDAVALAGGPSYIVLTGRKDGFSSKKTSVDLPSPNISWEEGLDYFKARGLDVQDFATLMGAHSMGNARCRYIRDRLYNYKATGKPDPSLNTTMIAELMNQCPQAYRGKREGLVALTEGSNDAYKFTNKYYTNILSQKAVLGIDQQLYYGSDTLELVQQFADPITGFQDFKKAFALSMNRLGTYKVLTGKQGEVRKNCHFTNSNNPHL